MSTGRTSLTASELLAIVSEANRAPSVHNVQPARFRFIALESSGYRIELYSDQSRRLLAGDPLRIDEGTSLGAAWEGLRIALERKSWELELDEWLDPGLSTAHPEHPELKLTAAGRTRPRPTNVLPFAPDPLAEFVFQRKAYRGKFKPAGPGQLQSLQNSLSPGAAAFFTSRGQIQQVIGLLQRATSRLARHAGVQKELLEWLRFDPRDPRFFEDGLNADSLGIPRAAGPAAKLLLNFCTQPGILQSGLGKVVMDESPVVRSASALLVLYVPTGAHALTRGRHLYRTWLEITRSGLAACPMSALADDPETSAALQNFHTAPNTVTVLNVFRVGVSPQPLLPLTPRLQPEKLVTS